MNTSSHTLTQLTQRYLSLLWGVTVSLMCGIPSNASACFWDKDTLAHERKAAPGVLEVISGNFPRRSTLVYEYRATRRPEQLREAGLGWLFEETSPTSPRALNDEELAWTDDLGVALDKLKRHQEAKLLLSRVLGLHPERYETLANLGTTLIHGGELEEGLKHLNKALEINPEAHFGRERIQIALVSYLIKNNKTEYKKAEPWPMSEECVYSLLPLTKDPFLKGELDAMWRRGQIHGGTSPTRSSKPAYLEPLPESMCMVMPSSWRASRPKVVKGECRGFCDFLKEQDVSREAGIEGVLGMMRFSDHTHPALLEALGDLLIENGRLGQNLLASMAYFQASQAPQISVRARRDYRTLAALSLVGHRFGLTELRKKLSPSLKKASRLAERIKRDEARWLKRGERYLERAYQKRYLKRTKRRRPRNVKKSAEAK